MKCRVRLPEQREVTREGRLWRKDQKLKCEDLVGGSWRRLHSTEERLLKVGGTLKITDTGSCKNGGDDDNEDDAIRPRPVEEEEEVSSDATEASCLKDNMG